MIQQKPRKENRLLRRQRFANEKGVISKRWHGKIPVCLVFPNTYYIGMSNLALHILYTTLNSHSDIVCSAVFLMKKNSCVLSESGKPLTSFDLVFITLSFELDFVNIPKILNCGRLAVLASERKEGDPIVVAGGICVMANPEPVSKFIDLFILGDIEATVPLFMKNIWTQLVRID